MSDEKKNICKDCVSSAYINFRPYCNHDKRFLEKPLDECENFDGGGVIYAPYVVADVSGATPECYEMLNKELERAILDEYERMKSKPLEAVLEEYQTNPIEMMCFLIMKKQESIHGEEYLETHTPAN